MIVNVLIYMDKKYEVFQIVRQRVSKRKENGTKVQQWKGV